MVEKKLTARLRCGPVGEERIPTRIVGIKTLERRVTLAHFVDIVNIILPQRKSVP